MKKETKAEIDAALEEVAKDVAEMEADMKKLNTAFAETMQVLGEVFAEVSPKKK